MTIMQKRTVTPSTRDYKKKMKRTPTFPNNILVIGVKENHSRADRLPIRTLRARRARYLADDKVIDRRHLTAAESDPLQAGTPRRNENNDLHKASLIGNPTPLEP